MQVLGLPCGFHSEIWEVLLHFWFFVFWDGASSCSQNWSETPYVNQAGLKLTKFLPQSHECYGYRCVPPHPALFFFLSIIIAWTFQLWILHLVPWWESFSRMTSTAKNHINICDHFSLTHLWLYFFYLILLKE
jgi:hypothetical protein